MKASNPGVLSDHRRKGKKLVPPLLASLGNRYLPYSWAREILPELIWIALIIDEFGVREGADLAISVMKAFDSFSHTEKRTHLSILTSYRSFSDGQKSAALSKIGSLKASKIGCSLSCLNRLCPEHPLSFLETPGEDIESTKAIDRLADLLPKLYDRTSREAVLTMATAMYLGAVQGVVRFVGELGQKFAEDLEHIVDYPETDRSKAAAGSFRANAAMFLNPLQDNEDHDSWLEEFWGSIAGLGPCAPSLSSDTEEVPDDPTAKMIFTYRNAVRKELHARLEAFSFDLNNIEPYEVVGALLARQATLAMEIALNPNCWTSHLAPMLLRGMADVHITLTWIFGDLEARSKRYVDDGLGAIKLEVAHRKRELSEVHDDDESDKIRSVKVGLAGC